MDTIESVIILSITTSCVASRLSEQMPRSGKLEIGFNKIFVIKFAAVTEAQIYTRKNSIVSRCSSQQWCMRTSSQHSKECTKITFDYY